MHFDRQRARREHGGALVFTVLALFLMTGLTLSAFSNVTHERRVAGFQNDTTLAFFAGDAAATEAMSLIEKVDERSDLPVFYSQGAPRTLGDAVIYSQHLTLPSFFGDPAFPDSIRWVRDGGGYADGGDLRAGRQRLVASLWQANVIGQSSSGNQVRIEILAHKPLASGY